MNIYISSMQAFLHADSFKKMINQYGIIFCIYRFVLSYCPWW